MLNSELCKHSHSIAKCCFQYHEIKLKLTLVFLTQHWNQLQLFDDVDSLHTFPPFRLDFVYSLDFFLFAQKAIRIEFLVCYSYAQKKKSLYMCLLFKGHSQSTVAPRQFSLFNISLAFLIAVFVRLLKFRMQNDIKNEQTNQMHKILFWKTE